MRIRKPTNTSSTSSPTKKKKKQSPDMKPSQQLCFQVKKVSPSRYALSISTINCLEALYRICNTFELDNTVLQMNVNRRTLYALTFINLFFTRGNHYVPLAIKLLQNYKPIYEDVLSDGDMKEFIAKPSLKTIFPVIMKTMNVLKEDPQLLKQLTDMYKLTQKL